MVVFHQSPGDSQLRGSGSAPHGRGLVRERPGQPVQTSPTRPSQAFCPLRSLDGDPRPPPQGKTWTPRGEDGGPHRERGPAPTSRVRRRCHVVGNTCWGSQTVRDRLSPSLSRQAGVDLLVTAASPTLWRPARMAVLVGGGGRTPRTQRAGRPLRREVSGVRSGDHKFQATPREWAAGETAAGASGDQ